MKSPAGLLVTSILALSYGIASQYEGYSFIFAKNSYNFHFIIVF